MHETIHTIVFEEKKGGGNPCPVTIHADDLSPADMQEMTKRFGQESAFLSSPTREGCDVRSRYYVPEHEMSMCVHATVGSAMVLAEKGLVKKSPIVFETSFGPVPVEWERKNGVIEAAVSQFLPKFRTDVPTREEIAKALRIPAEQILDGPIETVATSRFKLIIPLASKEVIYSLEPDYEYLWEVCDKYDVSGFYPYAVQEENGSPVFYARQFPQRAGYPEDPATGVAASALSAYLTAHRLIPVSEGWNAITVKQGESMGKPSVIGADCFVENGEITRTRVRGSAYIVPTPPEMRLKELGITLPPANTPIGSYVPGVRSGNLIFTSGQTPKEGNALKYTGKLGKDLTVEEGKDAARLCALSCLAIIRDLAGSLNRVKRVVKLTGFVNSDPSFTAQPKVVDGASDFIKEVFGEAGAHARAAVGMASLPGDAACEVEMIVELES